MPFNYRRASLFGATTRLTNQRAVYFGLLILAFALLILGRVEYEASERLRMRILDFAAPVIDVVSRPVAATREFLATLGDYLDVADQNRRLGEEVERLRQWEAAARALELENRQLEALLSVSPEPSTFVVAARMIADAGGPFIRSGIINAGARNGVGNGMAVTNEAGLLGRVVATAATSARVLFITDLNSRVPVVVERTGYRAILTGRNTDTPTLDFLAPDAAVIEGDRLVTSGHGGLLPPGIPVGAVSTVDSETIYISPFANWTRVNMVSVQNFRISADITERALEEMRP